MQKKTQLNIHAHNYIAAFFADRLRQEGFRCPDDKLLCWYRVRNQEVLDTIVFCTSWSNLPVELEIYYETVPLFISPVYTCSVLYPNSLLTRWDCSMRRSILEDSDINHANLCIFSEDILVYAPGHGKRGLYTLTDVILPYMQAINTAYDCHMIHKKSHRSTDPTIQYTNMSREFIDEALYVNDLEVLPRCKDRINRGLRYCQHLITRAPKNADWKKLLLLWQQLEMAIAENGREAYLEILQQRAQEHIAWLEKKLGINI